SREGKWHTSETAKRRRAAGGFLKSAQAVRVDVRAGGGGAGATCVLGVFAKVLGVATGAETAPGATEFQRAGTPECPPQHPLAAPLASKWRAPRFKGQAAFLRVVGGPGDCMRNATPEAAGPFPEPPGARGRCHQVN
ncbi:unnamed protein product, partial [Amoebophrya sp. A120]